MIYIDRYLSGLKSDRLVIVLSGFPGLPFPKILGIPVIPRSTGADQCSAIIAVLKEWECSEIVIAIVFDTTASNTGKFNGSCVGVEIFLARSVLWFACRHHVYEVHIKHVAAQINQTSTSPSNVLFVSFQNEFSNLKLGQEVIA